MLPTHHLTEEKQLVAHLVAVLLQEQALLSGKGEADRIVDVIGEKASIVAGMAQFADQRHQRLASLGFAASENGMQSWLDGHGTDIDKKHWEELFALAQSARAANRLNGLLVGKQMAINQNALNILQGHANIGGTFYGPDGSASRRIIGRSLGAG